MASMSRWLVGSSSSSRSRLRHERAREQHAAAPAARQRVDDRVGGQGEPASTSSTRCSSRQPSRSSSSCCSRPSRSSSAASPPSATVDGRVVVGGDEVARGRRARRRRRRRPAVRARAARPARGARLGAPGCRQIVPRVGRQLAADDLQQRRLARAVAADDRDALAGVDLERDVVEQRQVAEGDRDVVEGDQRHQPDSHYETRSPGVGGRGRAVHTSPVRNRSIRHEWRERPMMA